MPKPSQSRTEGGNQPPPPAEMDGEALPLPDETEDETLPPAAEMGGEAQPPAAETESDTQQPPAEIEGETVQAPPLPASVSKVLDDDNLLPEIIVRVSFPTTLVHAAAVCKRWFGLASDRAFLRRFRKLHSPRLLGFYLAEAQSDYPVYAAAARFFPMLPQPPPPELAAVVRRGSFSLDFHDGKRTDMAGCWNGRVVTRFLLQEEHTYRNRWGITFAVHHPLCSERGMTELPTLQLEFHDDSMCSFAHLISKEEGDTVSYFYVMIVDRVEPTSEAKSMAQVFMLRNGDDSWRKHLALPVDKLICPRSEPSPVLVDNKVYMASSWPQLVVLDLTASSFATIRLPPGVDFRNTMLSRADDSSAVYLIHAKELQLHIWLHKGGNWLQVDNICLREMCAHYLEDEPTAFLKINHVGDYTAEFLFLEIGRFALYLDVKSRTLHKVYEMTREDRSFGHIYPFMMTWPPIFPALKDGPASNAT